MDFDPEWLKRRVIMQGRAFWGLNDGQPYLGRHISWKPSKMAFLLACFESYFTMLLHI